MQGGSGGGRPGGAGINGGANGDGSARGGGAVTGADDGGIETMVVDPPAEGVGVGMKIGDGNLSFVILFRPWRSVRSPSRNFWSFKTW